MTPAIASNPTTWQTTEVSEIVQKAVQALHPDEAPITAIRWRTVPLESRPVSLTCHVCHKPITDANLANAQWRKGQYLRKDALFVHKGECSFSTEATMPAWKTLTDYLEELDSPDADAMEAERGEVERVLAGIEKQEQRQPERKPLIVRADPKFEDCCADKWQSYFPSRSEAIAYALVRLAYQYKSDEDIMRVVMERTPLCQAWNETGKWDRLAEQEISRAIKYVKAHPQEQEETRRAAEPCPLACELDYSFDADSFLAEKLQPRQPLITTDNGATLFYRKSVNQVFATRGIGKSLFVLAAVVKLLTVGGEWLRYRGKGGSRVLLIDGELPAEQLQERIREQVGPTNGLLRIISPERLPNNSLPALWEQSAQEWMLAQIKAARAEAVIFDTLTSCFRFDTNDPEKWLAVNQFFIQLRLLGLCVLIVHHAGKGGLQRGRSDGDDNLDVAIKLDPPKGWEPGDGAEFKVLYEKVRAGDRLKPFQAKLEPAQFPAVGHHWVESVDPVETQVEDLLRQGHSCRQIEAATGVPASTAWRIGKRLGIKPAAKAKPRVKQRETAPADESLEAVENVFDEGVSSK